jgi:hypothetical protein
VLTGYPLPDSGLAYTDVSVPALSSQQASGAASICAANLDRRVIKVIPPLDCTLTISATSAGGVPLYGGVSNELSGANCPTNALYIRGLNTGAALTIWES